MNQSLFGTLVSIAMLAALLCPTGCHRNREPVPQSPPQLAAVPAPRAEAQPAQPKRAKSEKAQAAKPPAAPEAPAADRSVGGRVVEYASVTLAPGVEQDEGSRAKIEQEIGICMKTVANARPAGTGGAKALMLQPTISDLRKVSTVGRVFAGAFAGNSRVTVQVAVKEKASGKMIASKELSNSANALGAAYSFGSSDTMMLIAVAKQICNYAASFR